MFRCFFLLLIISVFISGCDNFKKVDKTIICGSIENTDEQFIILQNSDILDTIFIDTDKKFYKSIQLNFPSYYYLRHGKEMITVYVKPGDSLFIESKADNYLESMKFSGSCIAENNYLLEEKKYEMNSDFSLTEFTQFDERVFIEKADSVYKSGLQKFEGIMQKFNGENEEFAKTEKAKLFYIWADNMVMYEAAYNSGSDKEKKYLDKNIQKYLSQVNFNDSSLIDFYEYRTFYESYINMKAGLLTKNFEALADMDFFTNKINILLQRTTNQKVKNKLLYDYFKNHIKLFGITGLNELYMKFTKECINKKYADEITKMYNQWKNIESGNIAPEFSLSDINGKIHSLTEFKSKIVYIDVWATWCAPCRREIPFLQKLYNEYKRKDIIFISISIDESKDAWKKLLEYEKPEWLQLYMEKGKSTLLDDYLISTIPRFILIGKDGRIIDAQAPAASGDIRKLLNS